MRVVKSAVPLALLPHKYLPLSHTLPTIFPAYKVHTANALGRT